MVPRKLKGANMFSVYAFTAMKSPMFILPRMTLRAAIIIVPTSVVLMIRACAMFSTDMLPWVLTLKR